jgi:hypothetical protein
VTAADHRGDTLADDGYFVVGGLDRAMAALDPITAVGFEAIVELDVEPDREALGEAWRRVVRRHPILDRRLAGDCWEPGGATAEVGVAGTAVIVRCDHRAFDGMGSVTVLDDLRSAYAGVLSGRAANPAPDRTCRVLEQCVTTSMPTGDRLALASRAAFRWRRAPASMHVDPAGEVPPEPASHRVVFDVGPTLERLSERRRRMGWSTDAMLVGLLEHAWSEVFGPAPGPSAWMVARDLAEPLGIERGIGNFAAVDDVVLGPDDLVGTIDRAHRELTAHWEDLLAGTVAAAGVPASAAALAAGYRRGRRLRHTRSVSNVGQLGDRLDDWGTATARRVYFVGPMAHPPYVSFIAAGRGSEALVCVRTSPGWLTDGDARRLGEAIREV